MPHYPYITYALLGLNCIITYRGLTNADFFNRYKFEVDGILVRKEYLRIISSGFLHVNWLHFALNMMSLYLFGELLEKNLGSENFLGIYAAGLIGGNALALFFHRHHGDYSAAGASGAVCGIVFATVAVYPTIEIGLLGLPFYMPGRWFCLGYVLLSIYGIRSGKDNIGHEAHLGGALLGLFIAILLFPAALKNNYLTILIITVPALLFILLIVWRPSLLLVDNLFSRSQSRAYTIDQRYNEAKADRQNELDNLLDKISRKGLHSLSKKERQRLDELSQKN